jgi:hypothetical protein
MIRLSISLPDSDAWVIDAMKAIARHDLTSVSQVAREILTQQLSSFQANFCQVSSSNQVEEDY